jgi:hypothetical protein
VVQPIACGRSPFKDNQGNTGFNEMWSLDERSMTDSHEFLHLLPFHTLLELALLRCAETETRKVLELSFMMLRPKLFLPVHLACFVLKIYLSSGKSRLSEVYYCTLLLVMGFD